MIAAAASNGVFLQHAESGCRFGACRRCAHPCPRPHRQGTGTSPLPTSDPRIEGHASAVRIERARPLIVARAEFALTVVPSDFDLELQFGIDS
jgi:hypothetical protein